MMQINLPENTIRDVQAFLASQGGAVDIEAFVDQSVQRALFFSTVENIHQRNADADPAEVESVIDEAVKATRENSGKPSADRS